MAVRDYIPIDKEDIPEMFEFDFPNGTFLLRVNYNESQDFFTVDVLTLSEEPIVLGEKLVLNQELWQDITDDRLPALSLVPLDESGNIERITYENFMHTVFLYIDDVGESNE